MLLKRQPRLNNIPDMTFLDVTNECNDDCQFCYHSSIKGEIKKEDIIKAIQEIKSDIILFTGGEPTTREDLFELLAYTKSIGKHPVLTTNGLKLEDINYLKEINKIGVGITLSFRDERVIPAMENMLSLGMYHTNSVCISVNNLEEIDDKLKIAMSFRLLWGDIRLRAILHKPYKKTNLFVSDFITYFFGRYGIENIDQRYYNNIYHINIVYQNMPIRLISWPNIMNVDITELQCSPFYYPTNENIVLAMLKNWKRTNNAET